MQHFSRSLQLMPTRLQALHRTLSHLLLCLQANLLQPLADPATLEMRLDAVGELLAEATLRADVQVRCRNRVQMLRLVGVQCLPGHDLTQAHC